MTQRSKSGGYQSVVCAVDFSPQSSAALQRAVEITRQAGRHLTALYVEDPLLVSGAAAAGYDKTLIGKTTLIQLERLVARYAEPTGLPADAWSVAVRVGNPAPTITKFAKRMNADLIVIGTHGRRGARKLLFGSVAEAVLRQAPAAVLVVAGGRPGRAALKLQSRPIVGALELGPHEREDAERIVRAAARMRGPLTLLHVVRRVPDISGIGPEVDALNHHHLTEGRKRLERVARGAGAVSRVAMGRPEDEIAVVAKEMKAGLIVLVLRRGRGLLGARQGTTTYRLLCASPTPVLALPPTVHR
jgi:nucleotide-binding universal stress UspA family protein